MVTTTTQPNQPTALALYNAFKAGKSSKNKTTTAANRQALESQLLVLFANISTNGASSANTQELSQLIDEWAKDTRARFSNVPESYLSAQDLALEVLVSMCKKLESGGVIDDPINYLGQCLSNRCRTAYRNFNRSLQRAKKQEQHEKEEQEKAIAREKEREFLENAVDILERAVAHIEETSTNTKERELFAKSWQHLKALVIEESATIEDVILSTAKEEGFSCETNAEYCQARNRIYARHKRCRTMLQEAVEEMVSKHLMSDQDAHTATQTIGFFSRRKTKNKSSVSLGNDTESQHDDGSANLEVKS